MIAQMWADIAAINAWIDSGSGLRENTRAEDMARVLKIGEEIGEATDAIRDTEPTLQDMQNLATISAAYGRAVAAIIGMTGQNPRKGITHDQNDLLRELADVALTALCAIQHFTQSAVRTEQVLSEKIQSVIARSPDIQRSIITLDYRAGAGTHVCRNGYCDPVCIFDGSKPDTLDELIAPTN